MDRTVSTSRTGVEMFSPLIILVAVLLGVEYFLSNTFYRRDDSQAKQELRRYPVSRPKLMSAFHSLSKQPDCIGWHRIYLLKI